MTTNITDGLLAHYSETNRSSTYSFAEGGRLRVRVKNPGGVNMDEMSYTERVDLARFLLADLPFGANLTVQDFAGGQGGPNTKIDRLTYLQAHDHEWQCSKEGHDLRTWVNHQDYSRIDGVWHDRIREYYKDRGY